MNAARLGIGAQSVGISEAAYRESVKYANERSQFGKDIIEFPAVYEMISVMKGKLFASRSLLYETSRYVDLYKTYQRTAEERKLEPEERKEMKRYQKLADGFTPLLKMVASEYCNQIAYDAIQVHGGTGYMKDFPVERLYRDARITSIYEGTSQLQVIAAIKGVTANIFLDKIREYEKESLRPELVFLRKTLIKMTAEYEQTVQNVTEMMDEELLDFHSRRLVEMAGNIIISYLLILDAMRNDEYQNVAEVFIKRAEANNKEKVYYINTTEHRDLGIIKQ
jgi:hypothetical protein